MGIDGFELLGSTGEDLIIRRAILDQMDQVRFAEQKRLASLIANDLGRILARAFKG